MVSRDTLNQQVWGSIVVTDQALTNCISELRHHLGDDRSANRVIETIPKRGYRLTAPVQLAQVDGFIARSASTVGRTFDGEQEPAFRSRAVASWRGAGESGVVVVARCTGARSHERGRAAIRECGRR